MECCLFFFWFKSYKEWNKRNHLVSTLMNVMKKVGGHNWWIIRSNSLRNWMKFRSLKNPCIQDQIIIVQIIIITIQIWLNYNVMCLKLTSKKFCFMNPTCQSDKINQNFDSFEKTKFGMCIAKWCFWCRNSHSPFSFSNAFLLLFSYVSCTSSSWISKDWVCWDNLNI
jgi:hypothetical protein